MEAELQVGDDDIGMESFEEKLLSTDPENGDKSLNGSNEDIGKTVKFEGDEGKEIITFTIGMTCPVCPTGLGRFPSEEHFRQHWQVRHQTVCPEWTCPALGCGRKFLRSFGAKQHMVSQHPGLESEPWEALVQNKTYIDPGNFDLPPVNNSVKKAKRSRKSKNVNKPHPETDLLPKPGPLQRPSNQTPEEELKSVRRELERLRTREGSAMNASSRWLWPTYVDIPTDEAMLRRFCFEGQAAMSVLFVALERFRAVSIATAKTDSKK